MVTCINIAEVSSAMHGCITVSIFIHQLKDIEMFLCFGDYK